MSKGIRTLLCVVLVAAASASQANEGRLIDPEQYRAAQLRAVGHPNELSRWNGMWAYDNGQPEQAKAHFERAAYFGDTLSQHFLTLMYWTGDGVDRDPVLAYVWSDLAAEGGRLDRLVALRENLWNSLSADQQSQARETGRTYYAKYGQAVTSKRLDAELRRLARNQTGSRLGQNVSRLEVGLGSSGAWGMPGRPNYDASQISGTRFYSPERTDHSSYREAETASLRELIRRAGTVGVGAVEPVDAASGQ